MDLPADHRVRVLELGTVWTEVSTRRRSGWLEEKRVAAAVQIPSVFRGMGGVTVLSTILWLLPPLRSSGSTGFAGLGAELMK